MEESPSPNSAEAADSGFVLFEVLVAAAILAMAGTMILLIGNNILSSGERELDRSVALTNVNAFSRELELVGANNISAVSPADDGVFGYSTNAVGGAASEPSSLVPIHIEVHPKVDTSRVELSVDLLVPSASRIPTK